MFRAECAAGHRAGRARQGDPRRRRPRSRRADDRGRARRLAQDDTAAGSSWTASRDARAGGSARPGPRRDRPRRAQRRARLRAARRDRRQRLLGRAAVEGRSDDAPDVVQHRLDVYHEKTEPLVEYYRPRGLLVPIHADRAVEDVSRRGPAGARTAGTMIIRKSKDEIETMSRAGASSRGRSPARRAREARRDHGRARRGRRDVHPLRGRRPDLQGLPRLPRRHLHVAELDGRPRDPRLVRSRAGTSSRSTSA